MSLKSSVVEYFTPRLIRRIFTPNNQNIAREDIFVLTEVGLPNDVLDFDFSYALFLRSDRELVIGKVLNGESVVLHVPSRSIVKGNDTFLAASLSQFIEQLYVYDHLWKVSIANNIFGDYRENQNHRKYAKLLQNELLEIDPDLLRKDNHYYWGSLIEDIELGIVG